MELNVIAISAICVIAVLVLMMIGVPLPFATGASAVIGIFLVWGVTGLGKMGVVVYTQFFNIQWATMPLFVLMAEIINATAIGSNLFDTANKWMSRLPGGLAVASLLAEAGMAATIGNSTTTALAVGKVSVPQMERLGYKKSFALGAILSGGVLGPLIPPSIPLIIYGMMSNTSIAQLFIAGIIPGILLVVMLAVYIIIACLVSPRLAPGRVGFSWKDRFSSLKQVWPVLILMLGILGGIYTGVMTATEAAGVAVVLILIIAIVFFNFRLPHLNRALKEAVILNGMCCFIIIGVTILTYLVATSGLAQSMANALLHSGLNKWAIVIIINIIILILGCFVDTLTIVLLTLPFFVPLVSGMGFSLVWFGIILTVNTELGMLTPPMGMNLFVLKQVFNVPIGTLIRGEAPFLGVIMLFLAVCIAFPGVATWLPGMMMGK
jgi:C4-dicarboxylate transporter, DctM subunit